MAKTYRDFTELMHTKEDLHVELRHCLYDYNGMTVLQHPLVYAVPYTVEMNAIYNEQLKCKTDHLEESFQQKQWNQFCFLHEKPHRVNAFSSIQKHLSDTEYWQLFGEIWTNIENHWQHIVDIKNLLASERPGRHQLMDEDEQKFLASLPDEFIIYRGHTNKNKMGFSWTLNYWHAHWFAKRFAKKDDPIIVTRGIVNKQDIHAVFLGRGEFEIAVNPENIKSMQKVKELKRPDVVAKILNITSTFKAAKSSYHGLVHWDKVERNGIAICANTPNADKLVCRLFAVLHDCQRWDDGDDPEHGVRAANYVLSVKNELGLKETQLNKLVEACRWHNDGKVSDDPTIGACWDSDRLDLPRVDIIPNPDLLSTTAAKSLIWKI